MMSSSVEVPLTTKPRRSEHEPPSLPQAKAIPSQSPISISDPPKVEDESHRTASVRTTQSWLRNLSFRLIFNIAAVIIRLIVRQIWELSHLSFQLLFNIIAVMIRKILDVWHMISRLIFNVTVMANWIVIQKALEIHGSRFQAVRTHTLSEPRTGTEDWGEGKNEVITCSSQERDVEVNVGARLRKTQLQLGKEEWLLEQSVELSAPVGKIGVFSGLTICAGIWMSWVGITCFLMYNLFLTEIFLELTLD
jgi:hypothetical protein